MNVKLNPNHLHMRMDRNDGSLWLTLEERGKPIRKLRDMTSTVYLALCADLVAQDGTLQVEREFTFKQGAQGDTPFKALMVLRIVEDNGVPTEVASDVTIYGGDDAGA